MKKCILFLLIFSLSLLIAAPCFASVIPVIDQSRTKAYPDKATPIHSPACHYTLTVRSGFTSVAASIVIENGDVNPITLAMGLPTVVESQYGVNQVSVSSEGQPINYEKKQCVEDPTSPGQAPMYDELYVWTITLAPSERKVVNVSFTTETKTDVFGTQAVIFPIDRLRLWHGDIEYMEIVADLDYYPAYTFNPVPNPIPDQYDSDGRLVWRFYNEDYPQSISLSFQPISNIINAFFKESMQQDQALAAVIQDFNSGRYYASDLGIVNYLVTHPEFLYVNELKLIQALSYVALCENESALTFLNALEGEPLFGEPYSTTIQNRIIFEKYWLLYNLPDDPSHQMAAEYIKTAAKAYSENDPFSMWLASQNSLLNPPVIPAVQEEQPTLTPMPSVTEPEASLTSMLPLQPVHILTYDVPLLYLIAAGAFVILILILVLAAKRNRHPYHGKKRRYKY